MQVDKSYFAIFGQSKRQVSKSLISFFTKGNGLYWIIAVLFILLPLAPWVFTRSSYHYHLDFTDKGQIGDTIGGLTAPIIGLINAALLFLTLKRQDEYIRNERIDKEYDQDFEFIRKSIKELSLTIELNELTLIHPELLVSGKQRGVALLTTLISIFDSIEGVLSYSPSFPDMKAFVLEVQQILLVADKCTSQIKSTNLSTLDKRNRYRFVVYLITPIKSIFERSVILNTEFPNDKRLEVFFIRDICEFDIFFKNLAESDPDKI